jgi:hypothetical protein
MTQAVAKASQNQAGNYITPTHTPSVCQSPPESASAAESLSKKPKPSFATMFQAAGDMFAGMTDEEVTQWEKAHGVYEMNKSTPISIERAQRLIDEYESLDKSD